jgi:protein arginine kinase
MIDLSLLTDGGVGWLDASGPSSHLVLSTRIRLARNLAGRVFQGRNSETEREDILGLVERAARE